MKKILAFTGIRSDYDLMSALYRRLAAAEEFDFRLVIGGAHLSHSYGNTQTYIQQDNVPVLLAVESLLDGDRPSSRIKSASILLQGVIDVVNAWSPDLIIYAGDREEVWIGALIGAYLEIPTLHFYGGDHTRTGHVDNPVRHAASKLSTAHFVSTAKHRARLVAIGEDLRRIFLVGSVALDSFVAEPEIPLVALRESLDLPFFEKDYALVIFHPDPSEKEEAGRIVEDMLDSLQAAGLGACISFPNTDPSNHSIIDVIERRRTDENVFSYRSLPRGEFIALYRNARLIIGNSSSGIMEAASVPLPAVNVGLRQRGRCTGENVLFCDSDRNSIDAAIATVKSREFMTKVTRTQNPYGNGQSVPKVIDLLNSVDFAEMRLKIEDPLDALGSDR